MNTLRILTIGASLKQNGGIATVENLIIKYAPAGTIIDHLTSHDEGSVFHRLVVFSKAIYQLFAKLLFTRIDILHIHLSEGGSIARKGIIASIALAFRKPIIIHTHGAEFPNSYDRMPKWAQQYLNWIFNRSSALIVLSQSWHDYYVDRCGLNPHRVIVLKNPTELPRSIPDRSERNGKVKAIFCGRIGERKGAFDLIQAFAQLPPDAQQSAELIMAGDGDLATARELVESLNLQECITFLGWIDPTQREQLLATADIFILPSYHEGLPMAILEAMSWGLPIISTTVGGIPEVIISDRNGILITPGNLPELTQAIETLIVDRSRRLALGKEARNSVKSFDIITYWDKLSHIFDTCTRSHLN